MGPPGCTGGPVGPHWCACRAQARSSAAAPRRACTSCCPRFLLREFRSSATGFAAGLPTRCGRPLQRRPRVVRPQRLTDDVVQPYHRSTEPIRAHPERGGEADRAPTPDRGDPRRAPAASRAVAAVRVQDLDHGRARARPLGHDRPDEHPAHHPGPGRAPFPSRRDDPGPAPTFFRGGTTDSGPKRRDDRHRRRIWRSP